jgi:hypothetical protein
MLIVTRAGDRRCKLPPTAAACPGRPAIPAPADTLAQLAAGLGVAVGTAHGVNVQVVTDPVGCCCGSRRHRPAAHDLTAARTHRIIRIGERQDVPILADRAHMGAPPVRDDTPQTPAGP